MSFAAWPRREGRECKGSRRQRDLISRMHSIRLLVMAVVVGVTLWFFVMKRPGQSQAQAAETPAFVVGHWQDFKKPDLAELQSKLTTTQFA